MLSNGLGFAFVILGVVSLFFDFPDDYGQPMITPWYFDILFILFGLYLIRWTTGFFKALNV